MFIKANTLKGYRLHARDGAFGKVAEFYFDDRHWTIRYLIADTGNWLTGRQVLISPYSLLDVNTAEHDITVDLSRKQIEGSPSLETDKPVSRQFEDSYFGYYGYPAYWGGSHMWGYHTDLVRDQDAWRVTSPAEKAWNPHLRSTRDVKGHHVEGTDGVVGHVDDFIIDERTWAIRYLLVATRNWWPGKKVLISPRWIKRVSWAESKVFVALSRDAIKSSPEYTGESVPTRDYEIGLHRHYNHRGYWVDERPTNDELRKHG